MKASVTAQVQGLFPSMISSPASFRRPNQDTAAKFHSARNQAFDTRAEVTGVVMAT